MILTGESGYTRGKTSSSSPLSTTYPTWTDPGFFFTNISLILVINQLNAQILVL